MNLNILVFNFKNKSIEAIYNGEYFNPYKYTVLLANYEDYWEPIIGKETGLFNLIQINQYFKK